MEQADTKVEAVEHSEASWLFSRPKSDSQATTPTMTSGARSIGPQKVLQQQDSLQTRRSEPASSACCDAQQENLPPQSTTPTPFKIQQSTPGSGAAQSVQLQNTARRRAAAEWIESLTGIALPTSSDHAFRGALRDGILLCKVLNILRPGIIPQVSASRHFISVSMTRTSCQILQACNTCDNPQSPTHQSMLSGARRNRD